MEFVVKVTTELSESEIEQINALFAEVFSQQRTLQEFLDRFANTPFGYSYHSLLKDEGRIVAADSCVPFWYLHGEERFIAAFGADTMVAKPYRGFSNVKRLIDKEKNRMRADGVHLRFGFPNDKMFPVVTKGFKSRAVGKLRIYVLPIRIGGIKPRLRWLNPLSRLAALFLCGLSHLSRGETAYSFNYRKERSSFDPFRYRWFGGDYQIVDSDHGRFVYRKKEHEGVATAFLLDVHPVSRCNFEQAVRHIHSKEHRNVDAILYIGHLPFLPVSLLRVPRKFEPKQFNFTASLLKAENFCDSLFDIRNWEINLSSFDLI